VYERETREKKERAILLAKNLEKAARYEEAAKIYEELGMFDEAGRQRRKEKEIRVVTVDLNVIIDQLKETGLTVAYRCPSCGAFIKIKGDTKPDSLSSCEYCGAMIDRIDLANFLKSVL